MAERLPRLLLHAEGAAVAAAVLLAAAGALWGSDAAVVLGLIWLTHIGVDRAVG